MNDRKAGRKPNNYESKTMRVPVELVPKFKADIAAYQLKVANDAKHDPDKAN